ncbi:MAG: hypothetical protein ABIH11_09055 [Candidatus Altiarchaeota archaeon]
MKKQAWQARLGLVLIFSTAALYYMHYLIFKDSHHIFIYMLGDIAFLPLEVLFVTLIIHELLNLKEKRSRLQKLNMVIGAFFSEVGTHLLTLFSDYDPGLDEIRGKLIVKGDWSDNDFATVSSSLGEYQYDIDLSVADLPGMRSFLVGKRGFLLRMLQNPTLLEHDSFTEMLQAVFHLTEELENRRDSTKLPESDLKHLQGDVKRAYERIVYEWLDYMRHLKLEYPYLFSLAMRTNPFDQDASPVVE